MMMTKEAIRLCIKRKDFDPVEIKRLYLHHKGFMEIRNLSSFTHVTHLFLEGNALTTINKLNAQKRLQSLYLQKNKLERIENLDCCLELKYLDVSNNLISMIDDLSRVLSLESLIVSQNLLSKPDSIQNVVYMKNLRELDLSKNKINCTPESILEILSKCKSLRILSLKGNPIAKTKHYRKLVISRCRKLTHLDGNPICKEERRRCNTWGKVVMNGGSYDEADEAGRQELEQIKFEKSEANALRRSLHGLGSDDGSTGSNKSKSISASVIENLKRTFGLIESDRAPSSYIDLNSKRLSKAELFSELEKVRSIVQSQRSEIIQLKEELGQKPSEEGVEETLLMLNSILDAGHTITDDSERDTPYSHAQNEQLAKKASLKELQQLSADVQRSNVQQVTTVADVKGNSFGVNAQKPNNRSLMCAGLEDFDTFSIMPPAPPPRHALT
ncbi:hypothetical protein ACHAXR_004854 [Thalassiosira sp. AJA248-18]